MKIGGVFPYLNLKLNFMNKGKIAVILLIIIVILLGLFLWKSSQKETNEEAYIPEIETPEINVNVPSEDANLDELNTAVKDLESLLQSQKSEKDLDDSNVGIE